jgi:AcrR family transcriptional regulator
MTRGKTPNKEDSRTRLIQAAGVMAFRNGFSQTSLADIAKEAKVPLGNVYYYFKTKEDIGRAVIEQRVVQMQESFRSWDEAGSAQERLCACVDAVRANKELLALGGCPVGSLCTELNKEGGALARKASALFTAQLDWIEEQFRACGRVKDARALAVHLLSALQGVSTLAHAFHDPSLVGMETTRLKEWIRSL